jgi:hypothetical protein
MKVSYQKELEKIKKIIAENPRGTTIMDISKNIGINRNVVGKYLDVLQTAGEIDVEIFGRSKVYFPSKSIPISTMIDYSDEFIAVISENLTTLEINAPFITFLGLKNKEKILGKTILNSPVADMHPSLISAIQKTIQTQQIYQDEIDLKKSPTAKPERFRIKYVPTILNDGEKGATIIISKAQRK